MKKLVVLLSVYSECGIVRDNAQENMEALKEPNPLEHHLCDDRGKRKIRLQQDVEELDELILRKAKYATRLHSREETAFPRPIRTRLSCG